MRHSVLLALGGLLLAAGGPSSCGPKEGYVALAPVAVVVPADKVWSSAQYFAALRPGAYVVKLEGKGMVPLYPPGTVLVIEPVLYDSLKEGMAVLFHDKAGVRMIHVLVGKTSDGWTTTALNEDYNILMPASAYEGVAIIAFSPEPTPPQ